MLLHQTLVVQKTFSPCAVNCNTDLTPFSIFCPRNPISSCASYFHSRSKFICSPILYRYHKLNRLPCFAISEKSDSNPDPVPNTDPHSKPKTTRRRVKSDVSKRKDEKPGGAFPTTIPRKARRGRRSEAVAVEDFVRDKLEQTFASIRQQNPEVFEAMENKMDGSVGHKVESEDSDDDDDDDDDDEISTGHSPIGTEDSHEKQEQVGVMTEEVATSDVPAKRLKLLNGGYGKSLVLDHANSVKPGESYDYDDDAESSYTKGRTQGVEIASILGRKRPRDDKIRNTLEILENLIPGGKGKDPLVILDEAIKYLISLKLKAKSQGAFPL